VSASVLLGLLLAVCCSLVGLLGLLFKQRGAVDAPPVRWRAPVASTVALFRNRWWTLGIVVATTGWFFHVGALALAPISLAQSVIAGGLVLLTVTADRVFGHSVTRREWVCVALTATGLAFLAATLGDTGDSAHASHPVGTLSAYVGLATVAGLALVPLARQRDGLVLALSAGLLWGGSDVAIKAISDHADRGLAVVLDPLSLVIFALSMIGLLVSARSLQLGPVVPVIAITSATANVFTIAAGPLVFREPLPDEPLGLTVRLLAFLFVIAAAALIPAPGVREPLRT
jgi:multidrug transporter EmrE-like cation transporter